MTTPRVYWRLAYWVSFVVWLTAGILVMMRRRGGWLTNYGDDVALPLWLYIVSRNLVGGRPELLHRMIGRTPESSFVAVTLACIGYEISQYFWPRGIFHGTFDPLDIAAYVIGTGTPYLAEKLSQRRSIEAGRLDEIVSGERTT